MPHLRLSVRQAALTIACLAPVPYLVLKSLWLSGSTIGTTSDAGINEMHQTRFVVGNVITVLLMLVAVAFAIALTRSWARRVPAWLVFVLGAGLGSLGWSPGPGAALPPSRGRLSCCSRRMATSNR